jgi:multicomponent Na+:H+ antiporter subunit C
MNFDTTLLDTGTIFGIAGMIVFGIGLFGALSARGSLRRVLALKLCGVGASFILIVAAWRGPAMPADPVPHALVITGIVVMVSATAVALALIRRIHSLENGRDD